MIRKQNKCSWCFNLWWYYRHFQWLHGVSRIYNNMGVFKTRNGYLFLIRTWLTRRKYICLAASPFLLIRLDDITEIIVNQTLELVCSAESIPPPNVTWFINGNLALKNNNSRVDLQTSGNSTKTSTLRLHRVQYSDRGVYWCMFSNNRGVVNSTTQLNVYGKSRPLW